MKPERTCLGCRQRAAQSELLRIVVRDGKVVADFSARLTGRGAWVHPTLDCVKTSITRKAFGRAFRVATALETGELLNQISPVGDLHHSDAGLPTEQAESTVTN